MENEFNQKVVVVTGASRGIGLQTVKEYAKRGAEVALIALKKDEIDQAIATITSGREHVKGFSCDLSDPKQIEKMAKQVWEQYHRIDIVVCNVGAFSDKMSWDEINDEIWHACIALNTLSSYYCIKFFAHYMVESHTQGVFVCTGSSTALRLKKGRLHYTVSKSALHSMVQVLALDLASDQIRLNVVSPGPTATEIVSERMADPAQKKDEDIRLRKIPMGRYAQMGDIANAILFLSSQQASFITGVILPVDGGYTIGEPF